MVRRPVTRCALLVGAVLAGLPAPVHATASRPVAVRPARSFVASVGLDVHLGYTDTTYARTRLVVRRIAELGIRHIRDGVPGNPQSRTAAHMLRAGGIRADMIIGGLLDHATPRMQAIAGLGSFVEAIESPNEPDHVGVAHWPRKLEAFLRATRRTLARIPSLARLPWLGPSFVRARSVHRVSAAPMRGTVANIHIYPAGGPPERPIARALRAFGLRPRRRSVYMTEAGYENALRAGTRGPTPVPAPVAGAYVPRLALESFRLGVRRTYLYELLDEWPDRRRRHPQSNFGLVRADGRPKPAFRSLRRLLALAAAAGPVVTPPPAPRVIGPRDLRTVALRRANGSLVVVVWRSVSLYVPRRHTTRSPRRLTVQLRFPRPIAKAVSIDFSQTSKAVRTTRRSRTVSLRLGGRPRAVVVTG